MLFSSTNYSCYSIEVLYNLNCTVCIELFKNYISISRFHHGPFRLSQLMRQSLSRDPLDPILAAGHYEAMDRRVAITLRVIRHCLSRYEPDQVLIGLHERKSQENKL